MISNPRINLIKPFINFIGNLLDAIILKSLINEKDNKYLLLKKYEKMKYFEKYMKMSIF